jgi:type I restriction-modification system DNA methylase subunit
MNLAIRGIDANLGAEHADSFRRDLHPDLKADYVLANPPFALAVPDPEAIRIRDDVAFFQTVKAAIVKSTGVAGRTEEDLDHAIRQIVSKAISAEGVIDLFSAAGLKKPNISILDDQFLAEEARPTGIGFVW